MKTFVYTATDVQGNMIKNAKMQAEDVNDFLEKVNEKGLFCSSYKETRGKSGTGLHKFTVKELSFNCRQLSAMLSSGLTLVKALDILYKEQVKDNCKQVFREIYEEVQKGNSFSEALKVQGSAFPMFFTSMVSAGESSGSLDIIMKRLEAYYAKTAALNNKIKGALVYPCILFVLTIAIVILMFTLVLPNFEGMMTGDNMNVLTKALFAISRVLKERWYIFVAAFALLVFIIIYLLKVPSFRLKFDKLLVKGPGFGPLIVKVYTGRFARTLSSLYSSGIPMVECIERSAAVLNNSYVSLMFETVVDEVKQGEQLSAAIQRTGIFESMFCSIIYVGEEAGALDEILEKSSDYYEEESDSAITRLVSMIEPVMLIIMGTAIGLVCAGILPSLYTMMDGISG